MPLGPASDASAPADLSARCRWGARLALGVAASVVVTTTMFGGNAAVASAPASLRIEQPVPTAVELAVPPPTASPEPPVPTATPEPPAPTPTAVPPTPTPVPPTPRPTIAPPTAIPSPVRQSVGPTPTRVTPRELKLPLKGMGYNPTYATADMPEELRAARIGRDMRLMSEAGVTMVLGWEPEVFDETLVAAADANGIAVLLPFDLKPAYNYAEPATRAQLTAAVLAWVDRYRDSPAIAMWAIGNEVTLDMSPAERHDFADFYAELFPKVRAADPSRPVILREAEDVFAPYLAEAFASHNLGTPAGEVLRAPEGFVYGVNFYTDRVGPALTGWVQTTGLDAPLLVSEYAPAGAGHAARPAGFARMYGQILAVGPRVLGSAPYTWTAIGPEAVDAYFGLVDGEGRPVDGSVAEFARLYGVEPPAWALSSAGVDLVTGAVELPQLIDKAVAVAEQRADDPTDPVAAEIARQAREFARDGIQAPDGGDRFRAVGRLTELARELSVVHQGNDRLFPGMREALPLLDGMARWSAVEPSAPDTARIFLATVLRRDLASLGS